MTNDSGTGQRVIFSTSEEAFGLAVRELKAELGARTAIDRLGPDVGVIDTTRLTPAMVAERCRRRPIVFVKHLTGEVAQLPVDTAPTLAQVAEAAADAVRTASFVRPKAEVAVQAWVSGKSPVDFGAAEAAGAIGDELRQQGLSPARAGQEAVISCCITETSILIGLNRAQDSLSDWPGGRVRLGRAPDQVSRSEFKLEELLRSGAVALPESGTALDLGAAPGGWTRILRQAGLKVVAVDPGDLDARVLADRKVRHARTTAGEFLRANRTTFDLVVNDMRMDPVTSARMMVDAAEHLTRGALGVLTLKTGTHEVLETIKECRAILRTRYDVVFVRQLQHNRHEVTVALRRL